MSRVLVRAGLVGLVALAPSLARAQALSCVASSTAGPVHPEGPNEREPRRILPIGGYTLAVTWSPEYCYGHARDPGARMQCGGENRFGFTLHGLWPDGIGPEWPQYCKDVGVLPSQVIAANLCSTPSAQLLQHEWAKHGTCTGLGAAAYFGRSTGLYHKLVFPNLTDTGRARSMTAGELAATIARVNPGVSPAMMRITAKRGGWLNEVWFCLDRRLAYTRCKTGTGGVPSTMMLRIATPRSARRRDDGDRYSDG